MIIVEGPDGSGKSNLVNKLSKNMRLPVHEKFSHSLTGPINNVMQAAYDDIARWSEMPFSIYDRHPFVSEAIYGRALPRPFEVMDDQHNLFFRQWVYLIICDPGFTTVSHNIVTSAQMPGVKENMAGIYSRYSLFHQNWPPDQLFIWNYKAPSLIHKYSALMARLSLHQKKWEAKFHA